jgi:catechol 2,3-dioxygenase-like lactoylglutathione lyase family enzyme
MPSVPPLSGLHHLKIPVSDLPVGLDWYSRVFGAEHLSELDHIDSDGIRFATILKFPGVPVPVELRWAPAAARALRECDSIVLAVDSTQHLDDWVEHLDALGIDHSSVLAGGASPVVVMADPDGKFIRLMLSPAGGSASTTLPSEHLDPEGPWLDPVPMRHPRPSAPGSA